MRSHKKSDWKAPSFPDWVSCVVIPACSGIYPGFGKPAQDRYWLSGQPVLLFDCPPSEKVSPCLQSEPLSLNAWPCQGSGATLRS